MIKKFEEFVNEGIIMKTIKRSLGNGVRKEENTIQNQIKNMNWIDLGENFDVLWAEEDLINNDGDYFFMIEQIQPYLNKEIMLPCSYDINQINRYCSIDGYDGTISRFNIELPFEKTTPPNDYKLKYNDKSYNVINDRICTGYRGGPIDSVFFKSYKRIVVDKLPSTEYIKHRGFRVRLVKNKTDKK